MNLTLYNKGSKKGLSQIWIDETMEGGRLRWYTGLRVKKHKDHWNGTRGKGGSYTLLNQELEKLDTRYKEIKIQLSRHNILNKDYVKFLLDCDSIHKTDDYVNEIAECIKKIPAKSELLEAFEAFILASKNGTRKTKKGKKIAAPTITKYENTLKSLKRFSKDTKYVLSWEKINDKFYDAITNYLWHTKDNYDNYVGTIISVLIAFLNWCTDTKIIGSKLYTSNWIVWKEEEVDALVLYPDELRLLYEMPIEKQDLDDIRDLYVFGCLTCLRSANLLHLKESDINIVGKVWHIAPVQVKVERTLWIRLHDIAISIIKKHRGKHKTLLPDVSYLQYNVGLKVLAAEFKKHIESLKDKKLITNDWDKPFSRVRFKQGNAIKTEIDICKMLRPHTQRSTGITNLLLMGMREFEVKKISGHSKNSPAFGRYVRIAQRFVDAQSDTAWDKIFKKKGKATAP